MNLLEVVLNHRTAFNSYHDHKERTAYAATMIYLSGASVWLLADAFWRHATCPVLVLATVIIVILSGLLLSFVVWQFGNRAVAALVERACVNVAARIVAGEIRLEEGVPHRAWREYLWPEPLVVELEAAERQPRPELRRSELITYGAIAVWTLLLLGRVFGAAWPR